MVAKVKKLNTRNEVISILAMLPEKSREILERRFGIGRNAPETLESIGGSYGITRERVRQIQEYGMKKLAAESHKKFFAPTFMAVENFIRANSGIVCKKDLFEKLVPEAGWPHLSLALRLMPGLLYAQESEEFNSRYSLDKGYLNAVDVFLRKVHKNLGMIGTPMNFSNLVSIARKEIPGDYPQMQDAVKHILLLVSKRIQRGPFGSYGLAEWPVIRPRGVRDKAYLVFEGEKKPLHFRELSKFIDAYFKDTAFSRSTHPQTVHNELIKDPRFVLVGRGLYALSEWGYEAGTVKDVLAQIFKEQGKGLYKEEVLDLLSKRRFVKPNTVFLNLQNKGYFKKQEDRKYYLA